MAIESGIKIAVDDAAFGAFFSKFLQYKATLDNTPEAWKKVSVSAEAAKDAFSETAESAAAQADAVGRATDNVGHLRQASEAVGRTWHTMARDSGTMLRNVTEMTKTLLEWGGITGLVGGIFTGGALTAFDSIASSITSQRTSALGAGTTIGRNTAADIAYGPLGGGSGFGAHIAQLQSSGTGLAYLAQLTGLPISQIETMDPNDLQGVVLASGQRIASGKSLQQLRYNPTLTQVFGGYPDTMNILHSPTVTQGYVEQQENKYKQLAPKLEPNNQVGWADFLQVLTTAKSSIETAFINRMAALSGPLEKLIAAFQSATTKFINSELFDDILKRVNQGMEWLAKEIDSPSFQKEVENFITSLGQLGPIFASLAQDVIGFAKWLGVDVGKPNLSLPKVDYENGPLPSYDQFRKMVRSDASGSAWTAAAGDGSGRSGTKGGPVDYSGGTATPSGAINTSKRTTMTAYAEGLHSQGFSDDAIAAMMGVVGGGEETAWQASNRHFDQPNWHGDPEGAYAHGLNQLGAGEYERYAAWLRAHGGGDWRDPKLQGQFAAWDIKTNYSQLWARLKHESPAAGEEDIQRTFEKGLPYPGGQAERYANRVRQMLPNLLSGEPQGHDTAESSLVQSTQPHKKTISPKKGSSSPIFLTVFGIPGSDSAQTAGQASTFSAALQ